MVSNMSHEQFFISDTHLFHANMLKFVDGKGHRIRKQFQNLEDMHETIIKNWNEVVKPQDYVYHLGDVTFQYHSSFNNVMSRLNGQKRLHIGNHDKIWNPNLMRWFDKAMLWHGFKEHNFTTSHFPLRLDGLRDGKFCVHGHTHDHVMDDPHYINVCVEQTGYRPVHLDEIKEYIKKVGD